MEIIPFDGNDEDVDSLQEEYNNNHEPSLADINIEEDMENNTQNDTKKMIVVAILGVLIGFGIGFLVFGTGNAGSNDEALEDADTMMEDEYMADTHSDTPAEPVTLETEVVLAVEDQNFGDTVAVSALSLDRTSWVVVFEDNEGVPGSILGARIYDAGEFADVDVPLLRGTVADSLYYVKLHSDNGDREFDFTQDVPYQTADAVEVMTTFQTFSGTPR